ncbi:MAG: cytochrome c oxidase subunit II [Gemmataceae bacterium]
MGCSLLLFATGAAPSNTSIFSPVSPPADTIRELFFLVVAVCAGILLVVEGVLIYSLLRFRRRPTDPTTEPPQVYGSTPIEIAWTTAPALIVFVFVLVLFRTEFKVRVDPERDLAGGQPLRVTVIGHQWWWEYVYEKYGDDEIRAADGQPLVTANELRVPASESGVKRPILLTLKSADVAHSFWVPRLTGKTDLIPGKVNTTWFQTDRPGTYLGQCAEYCGTQHANMLLRVVVDSPDRFRQWLDNERKPAAAPSNPELTEGRDVFLRTACVNCHRVRGTLAKGTFGPDLTHLMARKTIASGMVDNDPKELRQWVDDPQKTKPGCLMPAMKLSEREIDLVVLYLRSLK